MGPDGRTVVRLRAHMPGPLSEGDHVELDGESPRWWTVVSLRTIPWSDLVSAAGVRCERYELVLRESSPGERLAWEVMSS